MIKQHTKTGLNYLCKTTRTNIDSYKGSGHYWKRHIKAHGKEHVQNIWFCWFFDEESIKECALMLSEMYDIVNSDEWANLQPENGMDGASHGNTQMVGKTHSPETKKKMSVAAKGKPKSAESKRKMSEAKQGKTNKFRNQKHSKESKQNMSNGHSKGTVVTPWGRFFTISSAAQDDNSLFSKRYLLLIFKSLDELVPESVFSRKPIKRHQSKETWRDYGFDFISNHADSAT